MTRDPSFFLRLALAAAGIGGLVSAGDGPQPLHVWHGSAAGAQLGEAVAGIGDLDGDGHADLAVGVPGSGVRDAGEVRVLSGADGSLLFSVRGPGPQWRLGSALSAGLDVDGDGGPDLLAGAPHADRHGPGTGAALAVSGASGGTLVELAGPGAFHFFGAAVALVTDVDGDGHSDLLVGADMQPDEAGLKVGAAHLFSGADGSPLRVWSGHQDREGLGSAVADAGDVDADGTPDVILGAWEADGAGFDAGAARVVSGADGRVLHELGGDAGADHFGFAVAGLGDVNGDGHADVAVGAPNHDAGGDSAGRASVFSGADGSALWHVDGDAPGDELGRTLAALGDVDGDGVGDLAVTGSQLFNGGPGYVRICSGRDGAVIATLTGAEAGDHFGQAVSGAGDVNGDGRADVVVGAPNARAQGRVVGAAYVYALPERDP